MPKDLKQTKYLQIALSNEEYELFKQYAESTELGGPRKRSMSELAADWIRLQLWRQTECCLVAAEMVDEVMVKDPRQEKLCWGFKCSYCTIQKACFAGEAPEQTYAPTQECLDAMKPKARAAAEKFTGRDFLRDGMHQDPCGC